MLTSRNPGAGRTDAAPAATEDREWTWADNPREIPYEPRAWSVQQARKLEERFLSLAVLSPTGRAGSTLLQRICNARKKTLVWGEHNGVLCRFADIYRQAAYFSLAAKDQRERYFGGGEDPNLWIANMCCDLEHLQNAIVASARALLNSMYSQFAEGHDVLGFKEFRYGAAEIGLLQRCYPKLKILLLVRHPCNTWNSTPRAWHASLDDWASRWRTRTEEFIAVAAADPGCFLLRYEDLIGRDQKCLALLSEAARLTMPQIADVLSHKIGSAHQGIEDSQRRRIAELCGETMAKLDYH